MNKSHVVSSSELPDLTSRRLVAFVVVAYAVSWLVWAPLVLRAWGRWTGQPPRWLHLVGSLGPATAGLVLAAREGRARLFELAGQCWRAPPRWIAIAVGAPVVLFGIAVFAIVAMGATFELSAIGRSAEFPEMHPAIYIVANIVFYGFGEEIGWRGYLLPRARGGPTSARAVITVAIVWAAWHLPLFAFSPGMSSMGIAGATGWLASILAGSLLMAELYAASRSVLVVALFHAVLDILINSPVGGALQTALGALVTVAGFTAPLWVRRLRRGS